MLDLNDLDTLFALKGTHTPISYAPSASALEFLQQIHRRKSEGLKELIAEQGWPTKKTAGEHAAAAAFMVILHADYDPGFQYLCHALMLDAAKRGEVPLGFLAFLTDRILCNTAHHQRFGTQIREVTNGCFVPKPMEDADNVDALRQHVGLQETLTEYFQRVNAGDFLLYRPLLNGYAEELEAMKENKVVRFEKPEP